ncbi:putative thioredoxin-disulfide reductase [Rosa chinensis]|uniref:Putative thioredoxin-disulfide reductase n=1 Tax=Rosa chinensis TaxID=74649 RepID=A0A2P6Q5S0_ROSCH|nr:glutaredoxin isoform X2 [Rosa chinensis]PRQ29530.1 putative thioredoxin-disulfide reductase [Rosa chinensis]
MGEVWDLQYRVSKRRRSMALAKVQEIVSANPVVIFSERYESYSVCVKQLFFLKLGAPYKAIDLDDESDAIEIHAALAKWTGQMRLPSVFIGGKHIGDCLKTWDLHHEGKLVPLLTEAQVACPLAQVLTESPEDEFPQPTLEKRKSLE